MIVKSLETIKIYSLVDSIFSLKKSEGQNMLKNQKEDKMYRNLNLKKLTFTGGNVASECRNVRKTRRCGRAIKLLQFKTIYNI